MTQYTYLAFICFVHLRVLLSPKKLPSYCLACSYMSWKYAVFYQCSKSITVSALTDNLYERVFVACTFVSRVPRLVHEFQLHVHMYETCVRYAVVYQKSTSAHLHELIELQMNGGGMHHSVWCVHASPYRHGKHVHVRKWRTDACFLFTNRRQSVWWWRQVVCHGFAWRYDCAHWILCLSSKWMRASTQQIVVEQCLTRWRH